MGFRRSGRSLRSLSAVGKSRDSETLLQELTISDWLRGEAGGQDSETPPTDWLMTDCKQK